MAQGRPESDDEAPTDDVRVEERRNRREEVTAAAGEECVQVTQSEGGGGGGGGGVEVGGAPGRGTELRLGFK